MKKLRKESDRCRILEMRIQNIVWVLNRIQNIVWVLNRIQNIMLVLNRIVNEISWNF